jgi:hypothetical protein
MIDRQIHARNELIEELKDENRNLKIQIEGFKAALELANEKAISPKVDPPKFIDRVAALEQALSDVAMKNRDRDRIIAILEENLDRARADHLEQLRAIAQMLEPLATHEDKGSLYLSHFGKAAMVYLIQKVIYENIEKLDPKRSTYSDGF